MVCRAICVGFVTFATALAGCGDSTTVRITIAGSGTGSVITFDPRDGRELSCTETCEVTFPSGFLRLKLRAQYNARSTALELGGPDLVPDDASSNIAEVGPLEGDDLEVTATFTSWIELPTAFATTGGFAPDDELIIGTYFGVSKVSLAGNNHCAVFGGVPLTVVDVP